MNIAKKVEKLKSEIQAKRKELQEAFNLMLLEAAQDLFDSELNLVGFAWTQYTPYFNDGNECEFSANTDYPMVKLVKSLEEVDGRRKDYTDEFYHKDDNHPGYAIVKNVVKFLKQFSEDDFLEMFGDHVKIIVERSGLTVESYDHD